MYNSLGFDIDVGDPDGGFSLGVADQAETLLFTLSQPVRTIQLTWSYTNDVEAYAIFVNGQRLDAAQLTAALNAGDQQQLVVQNGPGGAEISSSDPTGGPFPPQAVMAFNVDDLGLGPISSIAIETLHADTDVTSFYTGINFALDNESIVCFASDTQVRTPEGEVRIGDLREGDLVWTLDGGARAVHWARSRAVAAEGARPGTHPVRIPAGALGPGAPRRDVVVSPQHRVLLRSRVIERMTGAAEVYVKAKHLIGWRGVQYTELRPRLKYTHVLLATHHALEVGGALFESLYPGAEALKSFDAVARYSIMRSSGAAVSCLADGLSRPELGGGRTATLLRRSAKNGVDLLEERPVDHMPVAMSGS